jgi:deoxyribodipyrimidine photolyase-like uncharacterized protein
VANPDQDTRDGNGRYIRTPDTATRDARACELRAQGWTLKRIAAELGYGHPDSVRDACRRAIRDIVQGPAEQLLAVHMERLESLYEAAVDVLEADHVVVSHGKVITMADEAGTEKPLTDHAPKLAAVAEARRTLESMRKLMGLDQPTKVNISGGVRYEVVGVDPEDLT